MKPIDITSGGVRLVIDSLESITGARAEPRIDGKGYRYQIEISGLGSVCVDHEIFAAVAVELARRGER